VCHHGGVRRLGFIAAALLATMLVMVAASSAKRPRPALTLHFRTSMVVDGSHFRSHERVRITSSVAAAKTVRANSRGAFTVTLTATPVDRCSAMFVRARGSAGSVAMVRRPPLPECAPMGTQGSSS
jgi:hypothetical protein